jgi:GNAT superfamily N-acetyltransferase
VSLPDLPRWVEANAIADDPHGWRKPIGDGFALGHDDARLIVIGGAADPASVAALATARPDHALLVAIERADLAVATGRAYERAWIHTLPAPDELPDDSGAVAIDSVPDVVDGALAGELAWALGRGPVYAAWLDGAPASFAFAPWRSARWFDVSVDTMPHARQLGLGAIVAAAMIRGERARGREPVWGANESNAASLALAERLGFEQVDALWVCAPRS